MAKLAIEIRLVGTTSILTLTGEVDVYSAHKLREIVISEINAGRPNLIIDLEHVDYIDSTGLGALIGGLKRATEHRGTIRLVCPNETVYKAFSITRLVRVFPIFDSVEAALAVDS